MNIRGKKGKYSERGVALVLVLAVLVLLLGLAVGFLSRVSNERTMASGYEAAVMAESLSETAVTLVQSQIHQASTHTSGSSIAPWASQPGMVRTFAQDGSTLNAYKLFSSGEMVTSGADLADSLAADQAYSTSPGLFTDMNSPVKITVGAQSQTVYPILTIDNAVMGFQIDSPPSGFANNPAAPMPVKWLYVLKKGQLVAPALSGGVLKIDGATTDNPIVGRVAFWTDDETCKLNINTSSQGTFWDIPRANIESERKFAAFQPARQEFQRYPGHPATTSLFPVLGPLLGLTSANSENPPPEFLKLIYNIAPRITEGGTRAATVKASSPITADSDRLYASIDELIFSPTRQSQQGTGTLKAIDKSVIEKSRFFLTASSRGPEVNLFHRPRVSIWPFNVGAKTNSEIDKLTAFASTVNGVPYYARREDSIHPSTDLSLNTGLLGYIKASMAAPFPGFGDGTFNQKFGIDSSQIPAQIIDYIRASNIMSSMDKGVNVFATPMGGFTDFKAANNTISGNGAGQVTPLVDATNDTKGFGRVPTLVKAVLHFYIDDIQDASGVSLLPGPVPTGTALTPKRSKVPLGKLNDLTSVSSINIKTRAVVYFDYFDPMLGYPVANYNFDVKATFTGAWTVRNSTDNLPQAMAFPDVTIPLRGNMGYGYDLTYQGTASAPRTSLSVGTVSNSGGLTGGERSILWGLNRFKDIRRNALPEFFDSTYPFVSNPLNLHPSKPPRQETDINGSVVFLLPKTGEYAGTFAFDGGTVTAEVLIDDRVIQKFTFTFPAFSKPLPIYDVDGVPPDEVPDLQQIVVDANFRNRAITAFPVGGEYGGGNYLAENPSSSASEGMSVYLMRPGDTIVSLEPAYGDPRLIAAKSVLTTDAGVGFTAGSRASGDFVPQADYFNTLNRHAVTARIDARNIAPKIGTGPNLRFGQLVDGVSYGRNARIDIPSRYVNGVRVFDANGGSATFTPDFDTGYGFMQDGGYVNRADEAIISDAIESDPKRLAWFLNSAISGKTDESFFSPNKQMPSAGMFGSLPVGVKRALPWTTLLFRPDPGGKHPGAVSPPDHLLLDLFWMPVVQPYALSEPFSTAGKVNVNYTVMPFTYIKRATALYGVLLPERIRAIQNKDVGNPSNADADLYKDAINVQALEDMSYPINVEETLKGFEARIGPDHLGAFISESEVCSLPLIPKNQTYRADFASASTWWRDRKVTGDNLRERPYTNILPKLTTKSNTYTVYVKTQSLKKRPGSAPDTWDEAKDTVTAEYRGSSTIERFIDSANPNIPDYLNQDTVKPLLDQYYRWRTISTKRFAP